MNTNKFLFFLNNCVKSMINVLLIFGKLNNKCDKFARVINRFWNKVHYCGRLNPNSDFSQSTSTDYKMFQSFFFGWHFWPTFRLHLKLYHTPKKSYLVCSLIKNQRNVGCANVFHRCWAVAKIQMEKNVDRKR